jgi:ATP-dependent helicase HrpB
VLPLYGDLPPGDQDAVLQAPGPEDARRVVLATSIAETSLTVPGVRVVVDGGWRRAPRLDPASGLSRLATLRISRSAATQRAGRAGREAPGVAIRLWTEALHRGLAAHDRPEILEAGCRRPRSIAQPGARHPPTSRSRTRRPRARSRPPTRC